MGQLLPQIDASVDLEGKVTASHGPAGPLRFGVARNRLGQRTVDAGKIAPSHPILPRQENVQAHLTGRQINLARLQQIAMH
jgi:hypothetical protein